MTHATYSGIWPVAPTPFHPDGQVDTEGMTRVLDTPLIATAQFAEFCPSPSTDLGQHSLRGFGAPMTLVTYPMT